MRTNKMKIMLATILSTAFMAANFAGFCPSVKAHAQTYCDDEYAGSGTQIDANYSIEYDYLVEHNEYRAYVAPSLSASGISGVSNYCAATTGTNIVTYYDRYYPNLIPSFNPGQMSGGNYIYYPNVGFPAIKTLFTTLYDYMQVNVGMEGTTEANFKSGLTRYINEKNYSMSYTSFHKNSSTVNISKAQELATQNKVGVLFLSKYNFVYEIFDNNNTRYVTMCVADIGHIVMVYGVYTVDYYKDNTKILTETYLEASSGFSSADKGFVKMDDYLKIENALIVNIT